MSSFKTLSIKSKLTAIIMLTSCIALLLACAAFVCLGLAQTAWKARRGADPGARGRFVLMLVAAVDAGILSLLLYLPWLRSLLSRNAAAAAV